jgi:hypothetical protein
MQVTVVLAQGQLGDRAREQEPEGPNDDGDVTGSPGTGIGSPTQALPRTSMQVIVVAQRQSKEASCHERSTHSGGGCSGWPRYSSGAWTGWNPE